MESARSPARPWEVSDHSVGLRVVAVASGTVGQWLYRWPRLLAWQKRFTGLVMLGLGLRLLLTSDAGAAGATAGGR